MSVAWDRACILCSCQCHRADNDLISMQLSEMHFLVLFSGNGTKLIWNNSSAISRFPNPLFHFWCPRPALQERPKLLFNVYSHTVHTQASFMCDQTQKYVKRNFSGVARAGWLRISRRLLHETQRSFGRWLRKLDVVCFIDRTLIEMRLFLHYRSILCLILLERFAKRCVGIVTMPICLTLTARTQSQTVIKYVVIENHKVYLRQTGKHTEDRACLWW